MNHASKKGGNSVLTIILIIVGSMFVVAICCIGGLIGLLYPAVQQAQAAANRTRVMNELRQIGLNIHSYSSLHQSLPPMYEDNGKLAKMSWRVAILESDFDYRNILKSYKKDEPWDSLANQSATFDRPVYYGADYPGASSPMGGHATRIFRVKLPKSQTPQRFRDITDGTGNTIMCVFLPDRATNWASNVDLTPDEIFQSLQNSQENKPVIVGFYDGSVRALSKNLSRKTFDALVSPRGGETVYVDSL